MSLTPCCNMRGPSHEAFGEQRPMIEPLPIRPQRAHDGEIGATFLQRFARFRGRAAKELQFEPGVARESTGATRIATIRAVT